MSRVLIVCVLASTLGCGDSATGTAAVRVDGEEGAVAGYTQTGDPRFVDGWTVSFDRVVASVMDIHLRASDGDDALLMSDAVLIDLHQGDAVTHEFMAVPARRWDLVSYRIAPPAADARLVAVDEAIRTRMVDAGASLLVEGEATKDDESVRFSFAIPLTVDNTECVDGFDGTSGIVVPESGRADVALTLHFDHLFFDNYATDDADMRFDAMAAVAVDGAVDLDALRAQNITDLRDAEGMPLTDGTEELLYDPGALSLEGPTLRDYVVAAASTVGHFRGEGHCEYR